MEAVKASPATPSSRKAAVEKWRRRSAVVRFWRTALPASIVAILVAITGWAIARGLLPGGERPPAEVADIEMITGRFFGRDRNDRAFLVAFSRALRDARNESRYSLDNPTFNLGAGRAKANRGVYQEDRNTLLLQGDVLIVDGQGGTIRTEAAEIDTRTGVVTNTAVPGSKGIQIESRMGKIAAEDYIIERNGAVTFNGRFSGEFKVKSK